LGEIRLGEMGLGEMGLGEMGQNPYSKCLKGQIGTCLLGTRWCNV